MAKGSQKSDHYYDDLADPFAPQRPPWRSLEPPWLNRLRVNITGQLSNQHFQGDRPNIFCFSTPRSGSTFLMELISNEAGMKTIDEPLSVRNPQVWKEVGYRDWKEATTATDREGRYKSYFNKLIAHRIGCYVDPVYRSGRVAQTNRVFFKVLHGGEDMIPWFEKTFGAKILVLVRHPIAVTLSHWRFPRLPHFMSQPVIRTQLTSEQMRLAEDILKGDNRFDYGILNWCFQNLFLTQKTLAPSIARISYEEMVMEPEKSAAYLQNELQLTSHFDATRLSATPSKTVIQRDQETRRRIEEGGADNRQFLIDRWQDRVSDQQVDRCFEILETFAITYYVPGSSMPVSEYRATLKV